MKQPALPRGQVRFVYQQQSYQKYNADLQKLRFVQPDKTEAHFENCHYYQNKPPPLCILHL